jgi:hypothetical protein
MEQAPFRPVAAWRSYSARPLVAGNRETEMPYKAILAAGLVLSAAGVLVPGASAQALSGTPQEQAACRPDVTKHCRGVQGDDDSVFVNCLVSHAPQLSARCRKVLEAHGKLPAR